MDTGENKVLLSVYEFFLAYGIAAPENEDDMFLLLGNLLDYGISESFPALTLVRACLMSADSKGCVEQKNALPCPMGEIAVASRYAKFLVDVDKRRRNAYAVWHREAQSHGLSRLVVWVLPKDDNLNFAERTEVEGIENQRSRRITGYLSIFRTNKIGEFDKVFLVKLTA